MYVKKQTKKAFTLIELLIVIAIIGILFVVLVSRVDFATDKAKATGVQTDFRAFQMAFEQVSKENAGFATFGWDTGDKSKDSLWSGKTTPDGQAYSYANKDKDAGDRVKNSYDQGDTNLNGIQEAGETWVGRKIYTEEWTGIWTLVNPNGKVDYSAVSALESAINANLDPKLHITIANPDANGRYFINMANQARDPWGKEYHGEYLTNATVDNMDRGAIILYSDGANGKNGSEHSIANGLVTVTVPGNNVAGQDDMCIVVCYTYTNGYGENKTTTHGFSNSQKFLSDKDTNESLVPNLPSDETSTLPVRNDLYGEYRVLEDQATTINVSNNFISLSNSGTIVAELPATYYSVNGKSLTVTNTGTYDGEYVLTNGGYLLYNGYPYAKRTDAWNNNNDNQYVFIHDGLMFSMLDANVPNMSSGESLVDILLDINNTLDMLVSMDIDISQLQYPFEYYDQKFTVKHIYDAVAYLNVLLSPEYYLENQQYIYKGVFATDKLLGNTFVSTRNYTSSNVTSILTTNVNVVLNDQLYSMALDSQLETGVYQFSTTEHNYYKGNPTDKIFIACDYYCYYGECTTYWDWMNSEYSNDTYLYTELGADINDSQCVFIPKERWHDTIYPYDWVDSANVLMVDNLLNGKQMVEFADGKLDLLPCKNNLVGFQQLGYWYDSNIGIVNDYIYSWDLISLQSGVYHSGCFKSVHTTGEEGIHERSLFEVYKRDSNFTEIDISKYITKTIDDNTWFDSESCTMHHIYTLTLTVDWTSLVSDYNITNDISGIFACELDSCLLELGELNNNSTYTIQYTHCGYDALPMGIAFCYNGIVYTGFAQ